MNTFTRRAFTAMSLALSVTAAHAEWPEKPIRIIVPSAAGGAPDIVVRVFATDLAKRLNQPVVVDNRPGAGGNIGMQALMTAPPDGYTIAYGNNATLATNEFLFSKLPYDPSKMEPIIDILTAGSVLVVNKDLPVRSVQDLVRYAKEQKTPISFASGGTGTSGHLGAELFKTMAGFEGQHIPYKGGPNAINDLIAGNVTFLFDNIASAGPNINGGRLRALAVTMKTRSPLFPDVPTMDEAGVKGFEMSAWGGFMAPPGTPKAIVARLNKEFNALLKDDKILAQLAKIAINPVGGTPEAFTAHINAERAKWGEIVRKSGAKVD